MTLQVDIINQARIDRKQWDALVNQSADGTVYCSYDYLCRCEGDWEAIIATNGGKLIHAIPVPFRKKSGIKYIYQSPLIPYLSVLSMPEIVVSNSFISFATAYLEKYNYVAKYFIKSSVPLPVSQCEITVHTGLHINLQHEYATIQKHYSPSRKIRLRQAQVALDIMRSSDLDLFITEHQTHTLPKINNLHTGQQMVMRDVWKNLYRNQALEIYFTKNKAGNIISGFLLGKTEHQLFYLDSFSTRDGRKQNGITLIIDHIIQANSQSAYSWLDLGDMGPASIAEFKMSFGPSRYSYHQYYRNNLPWFIQVPKKILNYFGLSSGQQMYQ